MRERRSGAALVALCGIVVLVVGTSCSLKRGKEATVPAVQQADKAAAQRRGGKPEAPFMANPFCTACHADFDEEKLVATHKAAGIGCERCHGESFRHRSDEANITAPELMYPREKVNPTCMMCHPRHQIQHVENHRSILEANLSVLETTPPDARAKKYCTDCHGRHHHMKVRTVQWDKCTGKLLR